MPSATLSIPPGTEHVRTARLVAVTAARRAGLSEETVDDVRLAVSEAVARAVARHRSAALDTAVEVVVRDEPGLFAVEVVDRTDGTAQHDAEAMSTDLALGLVRSLAPEVVEDTSPGATVLALRWPARM